MNKDHNTPANLKFFTAHKSEHYALLSWVTKSEDGLSFYEIQHSIGGRSWELIERFRAGNSTSHHEHSCTDLNPFEGENLYRIKILYTDRSHAFSNPVSLTFDSPPEDNVYPNPVGDRLFIKNEDWTNVLRIEIEHPSGELSSNPPFIQTLNPVIREYDFRNLSEGMYRVRTVGNTGNVKTVKVLKR